MELEALIGAEVELSTPDGRVFHFRVASLVPYAGEVYAVLEHMAEDGQLLVTHVETGADQAPVFVVVGEEDIITGVMEKLVARSIAKAMEDVQEQDHECSCGHHHHHDHDCHCGHHH
jgi:pimeloyl-ACP methyl ester carboxylesterase